MNNISKEELSRIEGFDIFEVAEKLEDGWNRRGESKDFWMDQFYKTDDIRLIDKKTNEVVWKQSEEF